MELSPAENSHLHPFCEVTKAKVAPMAGLWGQSSLPTLACCLPPQLLGWGQGTCRALEHLVQPSHRVCDILDPMILLPECLPQASLRWCVPGSLCTFLFTLRRPGCNTQLCHWFPHSKTKLLRHTFCEF